MERCPICGNTKRDCAFFKVWKDSEKKSKFEKLNHEIRDLASQIEKLETKKDELIDQLADLVYNVLRLRERYGFTWKQAHLLVEAGISVEDAKYFAPSYYPDEPEGYLYDVIGELI